MTTAGTPVWVRKRDGRLVPFEADRISRSLFAAAEECGRPDAFLARELADVVVHFLADETEGRTPSTVEVAEVVVKVLRELRHHDLAAAFDEHGRRRRHGGSTGLYDRPRASDESPAEAVEQCLRRYSLQTVFTRDLAAAHQDGLIALGGLEAPAELASCLAVPEAEEEALGGLAGACARVVVVEGPEHLLARLRPRRGAASAAWAERTAARYLRELALLERLTGRRVVLNVNSAQAPPWADAVAEGPLFAALRQPADTAPLAPLCDALLAQ